MSVRERVFFRMWAVAVLAHLAGNWHHGDIWPDPSVVGSLLFAAGILATLLILSPSRPLALALAVVVPVTAALEAPILGNHWLLAGFVSLAYLVTGGRWERFEPAARWILLVFYSFAAFAKLNTGFIDPELSCGVFYANQWLNSYGLTTIASTSPLAWLASWGSALIELSVPVLLIALPTRRWGVLLALIFHGFISLDLSQHFYDFTAVLFALFVLFLGDHFFERFEALGGRIGLRGQRLLRVLVAVIGVLVSVFANFPLTVGSLWFLQTASFLWWIPYLLAVIWVAAGTVASRPLDWRIGPAGVVLVGLVFLNGLTPYLELKTAYGWNMYSNLVTVDGESNHLLVRGTLPLRDGHENLVTIVKSDDPGLQAYSEGGYLLPWPSLRYYLAANPDVALTYERGDEVAEVARAGDSDLADPIPWWWRWMPLRAVNGDVPARCQTFVLPAL
jgi:hypothetical protein